MKIKKRYHLQKKKLKKVLSHLGNYSTLIKPKSRVEILESDPYEIILVDNGRYVIKELGIKEGHRISLQYHEKKHETWIIQQGVGAVTIGNTMENVVAGKIFDIPPKTVHRIFSGKGLMKVIEVSTPELDDIIRLEDDYERVE